MRTIPRRHRPDLLARAPSGTMTADPGWVALVVDPVAQLGELADLTRRGLLSTEEYDRLKARVVATGVAVSWMGAGEPPRPPRPGS
jgi:hypothetical protein